MHQKLKEIVKILQSKGEIREIEFKHELFKGKSIEAKIFLNDNIPDYTITNITGYNEVYITKKFKHTLFSAFYLPPVEIGDEIRVLGYFPPVGEHPLNKNTQYYSVNSNTIYCGGAILGQQFIARYKMHTTNEPCMTQTSVSPSGKDYIILKIQGYGDTN